MREELFHEIDLGYGKVLSVRDIENQYKLSEIDGFLYAWQSLPMLSCP